MTVGIVPNRIFPLVIVRMLLCTFHSTTFFKSFNGFCTQTTKMDVAILKTDVSEFFRRFLLVNNR